MFFPELTYAFTPKDLTSVFTELVHRGNQETDTATTLTMSLSGIPQDRMLMLANVTIDAVPGATQAVTQILLQIETHAALQSAIARERFVVAADVDRTLNWQGQVFVLGQGAGNDSVIASISFDAGVNANVARASFSGVIVPRGNIAAF